MLPGFYRAIYSPHLTCGHTAALERLLTLAWSNVLLCAVEAAVRTTDSSLSLILHLFPKPQLPFHVLTTTYVITTHPALQKKPQRYSPCGTSAECSLKSWTRGAQHRTWESHTAAWTCNIWMGCLGTCCAILLLAWVLTLVYYNHTQK